MRTDVLVVGGGLAGCSLAYFLAKEGVDVIVIERHALNKMASGSNAGSLHCQIPNTEFLENGENWVRGFAPVLKLMKKSICLWETLEKELNADFEISKSGGLLIAETEDQMHDIERKAKFERQQGIEMEILCRDDLLKMAPYVSDKMLGAAYCPDEGKANPHKATPAIAAAAGSYGARIYNHTSVDAIEPVGDGFQIKTSMGNISARRVVNAAGAQAADIAGMLGIKLDIAGFPIQVNVTEPAPPLVKHLLYFAGDRLTLKQARSGGFLIGGGWPSTINRQTGQLSVNPQSVRKNMHAALSLIPSLFDVRLLRTWPAIVNGTKDWKPLLGEVPGVKGFYMNMFPWMGFTAGPMSARIVADLILGRQSSMDMRGISVLHQ
jgi:sarcosine oxidase subunit beta